MDNTGEGTLRRRHAPAASQFSPTADRLGPKGHGSAVMKHVGHHATRIGNPAAPRSAILRLRQMDVRDGVTLGGSSRGWCGVGNQPDATDGWDAPRSKGPV